MFAHVYFCSINYAVLVLNMNSIISEMKRLYICKSFKTILDENVNEML